MRFIVLFAGKYVSLKRACQSRISLGLGPVICSNPDIILLERIIETILVLHGLATDLL
jgi:hypothetical protein